MGFVTSVQSEAVLASSGAESAISAETEAAASAAAPVLLGVLPMGGDPDSAIRPRSRSRMSLRPPFNQLAITRSPMR